MKVPVLGEGLREVLEALRAEGGRPYLVGGAVRDALLGIGVHELDIEVFGLDAETLRRVLSAHGTVDAVGQAFTVYKVSGLKGVRGSVDVSLPRRDSKVGAGHRGFAVRGDPHLSIEDAARRRDFTINALLLDPWTGEVLDPYGGLLDLEARLLRAVDPETFVEDPLRALRAAQMAARFELVVDPATAALCASMSIAIRELPAERVFGEIEKLLLKAARPSRGFALLKDFGLLPSVAPELVPLEATAQDPEWHPEGDVFTHTLLAIDQAAGLIAELDRPRALAVMLAALCHDLGKPATTKFEDGRIRSRGHEEAGLQPTEALLDRWNVHTLSGFDLRGQVLGLVSNHLKPGQLYDDRERVSDGAIRRLARKCEPALLYLVAKADCLGRTGNFPPTAMEWFLERVRALDVQERPPAPLLRGRDLLALGVPPGPRVGEVLRAVYERQLDGEVKSLEEAREEAQRLLGDVSRA
ncbi:MAG TPA: HD domain-containing protein [Vicinamibacteria bacterium]|jgi:tRNA nucleotidyltransferase (CCA-adding enzyme)|nr:HD domain-containing protein [Vicinamibacteria bacterium]